eukprot:795274-Rhodomonas_salina.2
MYSPSHNNVLNVAGAKMYSKLQLIHVYPGYLGIFVGFSIGYPGIRYRGVRLVCRADPDRVRVCLAALAESVFSPS